MRCPAEGKVARDKILILGSFFTLFYDVHDGLLATPMATPIRPLFLYYTIMTH